MRNFNGGSQTKEFFEESDRISSTRLTFENDEYLINIDKRRNYEEQRKNLKNKGGFFLLYSGELTKKKGPINLKELKDVFRCFSNFLWFLNGRRCSPLFIQGIVQDNTVWTDYSRNLVDQYKYIITWPKRYSIEGLNKLWQHFSNDWKNENDRNFFISAIHWYIESNSNSGFAEGAIIMAQTALELIYNYLIIEKKKLLKGKDAASILASNKIRLLLSLLNIDFEIPSAFLHLQSIAKRLEAEDAPDVFVKIRNAIVHSQEVKRKELTNMHDEVKHEALQLALWYIELSLLYILKFDGKYFNRTLVDYSAIESDEVFVPWK
ncbi:hypothetical protein [Adhaeribacter pallidiroseus]|uniref:YopA central domain-containing protein n=1 Tax=Adhaeribacter pallidiroseus TaxID=2072847 RepID=A0A369QP87_9BACT|nr:hypothetical protein [Adhaeribacter pallidiroseus]RDC64028.1 hypothetical protein AHMF7616_02638 [Adhaeribacter pallidiroseus]